MSGDQLLAGTLGSPEAEQSVSSLVLQQYRGSRLRCQSELTRGSRDQSE